MSTNEAPKLYVNKPKKAQLKKNQQQHQQRQPHPSPSPSPSPSPASTASSLSMASNAATPASTTPPPPQPPKESFARRYRFLWPVLLAVNFSIGAYLFMRTKKKENIEGEVPDVTSTTTTTTTVPAALVTGQSTAPPAIPESVKAHELIPEYQQRELFKWILEEKRKVKPKDAEEKKRIDEEKAILKQFIRAKSVPSL